jgi:sugar-specific transcriptional regulator TrmB
MVAFEERLQKSGLTGNEAKVYLELLKRGSSSANVLAKKIGMDRTLVYTVLNQLIEKGLVNYVVKANKKFFSPSDPENLLNPVKERSAFIKDLIPELKKIEKIQEIPQKINVYEGKEGLRVMINLALKEKEYCAFGATGRAFYALYEMPRVAKQIMKSNIKVRIIGNAKLKETEPFAFKKFEYRFLNIDSEATTNIFGDYVAIHLIKQKPLVIIIKNKLIAQTYKNHFEVLWKIAKKS